jgi:3-isopropylmalate/(R)-2-methylmalate dehydratase small subunit
VPVELDAATVTRLIELAREDPATEIVIDIADRTVTAPDVRAAFPLDDFSRTRLLEGLDDIALTLRHEPAITAYEGRRPQWLPRVTAR